MNQLLDGNKRISLNVNLISKIVNTEYNWSKASKSHPHLLSIVLLI